MKRLLTLFACLLMAGMALADKVSEREALKKAQAFMPGERFKLQKYSSSAGGQTVENPFYIFNVENGGGYVIVSGNDQTTSILGYSTNGNIDMNNIPDNLRYWLESYAEQLKAIDNGTLAAPAPSRARTRGERTNIEPLIQTLWNQDEPYNLMCPDGSGKDYNADGYNPNNRCVTGCVATAVAQVMYYHQWPEQTTGIASYTPTTINVTLEALPATTLEWSKMKLTYDSNETGDAADAVAKLMRYVGQAMIMNYNIASRGGSGTNIYEDAMINVFNYSKKIHTRNRDYYTTKQWEDMVYDELAHGRPVPYGGFSSSVGHQFVCDGYKDGLFSLNWGWGGRLNGYFVLSLADPNGQQGIGGSNGGYKNDQDAVFYFMPAEENEEEVPILKSADGINNTQTSNYIRSDATKNFSNVEIPCRFESCYSYRPTGTYDAEVGWGLYQDEELIQSISSASQTIDMRNIHFPKVQYQTYSSNVIANPFGSGLSDGKYQLRQIWRKAGSNDAWTLMDNYGTNYLVAEINGTSLTIRSKDAQTQVFSVNSISMPDEAIEGEPVTVTVNITNEGETQQETVCLWLQEVGTSDWTKVASATGNIGPEETGDIILTFTPKAGGSFIMKVTNNESDKALATKENITIYDVFQVTVDDIKYSCITGKNIATVIAGDYESLTNVMIPATITVDNVEYAVKSVGEDAFFNCRELETVILSEGIQSLGARAFRQCTNMKKLELPSTLSSIGQSVLDDCTSLAKVISHIMDPFQIDDNTFTTHRYNSSTQQYENAPSPAILYVPIGTMSKYQAITGWTKFKSIEEGEEKETTVNGLNYRYYTGTKKATVISGDYQQLTNVDIPATITIDDEEYTVNAIGAEAFSQCRNLQNISLPDGLETIGDDAFNGNNQMDEFDIPSKLKSIGDNAFTKCHKLKEVVLPEGLETIGVSAFEACSGLQKLLLPSTLSSIGKNVINGCSALKTVVSHIQEPFLIDDKTFVTTSYDYRTRQYEDTPSPATLFVPLGTSLKYQEITGWTMFKAIEEGELMETTVNGLKFNYTTGSKKATVIAGDYSSLTELEIPATITVDNTEYAVKAIGDEAFRQCNFTTVSLPDGLEEIGENAFYNCYRLTNVVFPEGLKSIGNYAFKSCSKLEKVELPSTLESIGEQAFFMIGTLKTVISDIQEPFDINDLTFARSYGIPSDATLFVPLGTASKYEAITGWTMFKAIEEGEAKEATLNGLNYLYYTGSKKAFVIAGDYSSLTSVEITATITIEDVEYTVKAINKGAFSSCSSLASISLPEGLERIEDSAFQSCSSLEEITLPEGLESLGSSAFMNCSNLKTLVLPSTLKSIGESVINRAGSLKYVFSHITNPFAISDNTFKSNYLASPATLYVPTGTKEAYQAIKGWTFFQAIEEGEAKVASVNGINYFCNIDSKKATVIAGNYPWTVEIPATITVDDAEYAVKAIGASAFYNFGGGKIILPEGLEMIDDKAFNLCYNLSSIVLPKGLESIGSKALSGCFSLKTIELPSSLKRIGGKAFEGNSYMKTVISHILNPFDISDDTFMYNGEPSPATLYVPAGTKSKYEEATGWNFQGGIVEMEPGDGDADGNGEITMADVMAILSYLLGEIPDGFDETAADINGDGEVTISDALIVMGMIPQD